MITKENFLNDIKSGTNIKISLMVMKIMFKDASKFVCILVDKSGEVKANIPSKNGDITEGSVIEVEGFKDKNLDVKKYKFILDYNLSDYLPTVKRPIEDIMNEMDTLTNKYIISNEGKALNDYFFKNELFLDKFQRGIGGVSMHHNYIGGLAEHTLNVMYLTATLCERYECKRTEIAVLAAKLHDIGKIYELYYDGPFKYTLRGEMEGHIVIGVELLDRAIRENESLYSEDFITRIKGCLVQHHGKPEFGSPRGMKMEESFIVNFADSTDATMNKISQMKDKTEPGNWSDYDRRIDTKLYL
ncbi:3'-5' exoribonuclease YhaM family protein [Clostridium estertheticum]|uniref:3'-5' exoribonuclease YhaM family protein n=1 Tax=Clostridium estertheticum TaxID=238834 RepID=UPI001C0AE91A|nr:3'-5' exoribonuclease YhaM family protein [Clostridium estertheticum]MBU3215161.1 3'-5' exoribonuclease YhaM family protein [Clostridium estertheticum]MBW9173957.1 3'-5' exoribonuclease YhaM family protein [Clostridium estertheticum]MBX4261111.1 3'-5' exoribonuclease YhaM family protein [Clostridium estertheticum]MBX4263334.1 3'-5' exoribonuclease YhaM family protein [Clostridium estertheticum]WAG55551.1 3'-5' exoribonuclease YhaM family protein [Clostridium estertheticum]